MAKMTVRARIVAVLLLGSVHIAGAQDTRPAEYGRVDGILNVVYQRVLNDLPEPEQRKLKSAQRAWVAFRDLDCRWAFPADPVDCMIDRTANRVRELEATLFFDKRGRYRLGDGR